MNEFQKQRGGIIRKSGLPSEAGWNSYNFDIFGVKVKTSKQRFFLRQDGHHRHAIHASAPLSSFVNAVTIVIVTAMASQVAASQSCLFFSLTSGQW